MVWRRRRLRWCRGVIVAGVVACVIIFEMIYHKLENTKVFGLQRKDAIYTKVPSADIYIFSVIGVNTTKSSQWDTYAVSTWFYENANHSIRCCYLMSDDNLLIRESILIHQRTEMFNQTAQIECQTPDTNMEGMAVMGISLTMSHHCSSAKSDYVQPILPLKPLPKFNMAVCAKIAYGDLDPELTIEWMEYYKLMGVDHVLIYKYKLSQTSTRVLEHYSQKGFLEVLEFNFPNQDNSNRRVGDKTIDVWNDEQVVVFDCQTRLRGYTYVAVIDLDEFIVPLRDRNFEEMLNRLMRLVPNAAAIGFYSEIFTLDWGKTNPSEPLTIGQFRNRTISEKPIDINQRKLIHLPARVERGSVVTHGCKLGTSANFTIWRDPMSILAVNHYRRCVTFRDDCFTRMRTTDTRIMKYSRKITKSVLKAKELISKQCHVCVFN